MMKSTVLASVLFVCIASTSHADPAYHLSWNNCWGVGDASQNVTYACDGSRDGNPYKAVFSFFAPVSMDQFVGVQATLDFTAGIPALPDWWTFDQGKVEPTGPGCRTGSFTYPVSFAGVGDTTTCTNPWADAPHTGGGFAYYFQNKGDDPITPTPWPGYGRIKFAFARDNEKHLDGGKHYLAGVFTLDTIVDKGYGVCSGCELPVCLVMTGVELYQTAFAPPQDIFFLNDPIGGTITWQGGNVGIGCPASVPVRRSTWGSIKATYR